MSTEKFKDIVTINLRPVRRGDTTREINFQVVYTPQTAGLTGAKIRMWLLDRKDLKAPNPAPIKEFTTDNGGFTITDAALHKFKLNKYLCCVAPGDYDFDVEITYADGEIKTWYQGIYKVLDDKTK